MSPITQLRHIVLALSVLYTLSILNYFTFDPGLPLFQGNPVIFKNPGWRVLFYIHLSGGIFILLFGALLLYPRFRQKKRLVNVYAWICIFTAIPSFIISLKATGNFASQLGFASMAICWFIFSLMILLWKNNPLQRNQWFLRSFALTFSPVMLRLYMILFSQTFGVPTHEAYITAVWMSWVMNLMFVEGWLVMKKRDGEE